MKKKYVLPLMVFGLVASLTGCQETLTDSSDDSSGTSTSVSSAPTMKNRIECQSITIYCDGVRVDYLIRKEEDRLVVEYANADNSKRIYTDNYFAYIDETQSENKTSKVYVHESRKGSYEEYFFVDFIGFVKLKQNYYLDVENRIIDVETKYCLYETDTPYKIRYGSKEKEADNHLAYELASKGSYYPEIPYNYPRGVPQIDIYLNELDGSLERHEYYTYSEQYTFEYRVRG